jgi:peptide/nickel transport system ATP-binding protein
MPVSPPPGRPTASSAPHPDEPAAQLLSITNLEVSFRIRHGDVPALRGIDLAIDRGRTTALVGESGSGKSMTALSIMRLVPAPGCITAGNIFLGGTDLLALPAEQMRTIRGSRISMVFQEPMTSLNPVMRIGDQIAEPLRLHCGMSRNDAAEQAAELLRKVGIPSPGDRLTDYPHQLSGGMRQRVMIAMALACNPALLIADEPTTALDVTIQAQILELLDTLRQSSRMGILLITHDLGIVAERAELTYVMYAGRIVEKAPTATLFAGPRHPYTLALLASLPQNNEPGTPLAVLPGAPPDLASIQNGCGFCERCPDAVSHCREELPELKAVADGHYVRCWRRQ